MKLAVLHKGNLAECVVCNPELVVEKKEKRVKIERPADYYLRQQINEELGDDEATREERSQLQEKYGVSAPRIDRRIKRPNWMGRTEWQKRVQSWFTMTKGLVPAVQEKKPVKRYQGTTTGRFSGKRPNQSYRSFNRTQTATRPS